MSAKWFKKQAGYIFLYPCGNSAYCSDISFLYNDFTAVDRNSHSNSDTLYRIFPYFVSAFTILFWIASNKSGEAKTDEHIYN